MLWNSRFDKNKYEKFEFDINEFSNLELPFEIYTEKVKNKLNKKKQIRIPGWTKWVFLNSKVLYLFLSNRKNDITSFFKKEIKSDPQLTEIDQTLIDSILKELEELDL